MFEGRFAELLVIFVLALVILGPEKLPRVVAEFGRWVGRARTMARQFREQLEEEVRFEEAKKAQAARPPEPAAPVDSPAPENPDQPPVDVATALNPHTEAASPIDVAGLPPELAQAAQTLTPMPGTEAVAQVTPGTPAAAEPAAAPPGEPGGAEAAPQPVREGQHS